MFYGKKQTQETMYMSCIHLVEIREMSNRDGLLKDIYFEMVIIRGFNLPLLQ